MSHRPAQGFMYAFVALAASLAFLALEVAKESRAIIIADVRFERLLPAAHSVPLLRIFGWITHLGDTAVVVGIAALASIVMSLYKIDRAYLAGLASTLLGAALSNYAIKAVVARARPGGLISSSIIETSFSFPSGHATAALALYGFMAYMLCRLYPRHAGKIAVAGAGAVLAVGASRLYLGVHFPSDVIAGYLLGGLWLLFGIGITGRLRLLKESL